MIEEKRFVGSGSDFDGELLHRALEWCRTRGAEPLILEFGHITLEAKGKIKALRLLKVTILSDKEWEDGKKTGQRRTGSGGQAS